MSKSQPKTDENPDVITLASETMAGDLRDFLLDRLKHDHNPLPWNMRPEKEQIEAISQAEQAVRRWVHKAVLLIASGGQQAARGSMVKLQAKDGIQMQINLAASDPLRHQLMDNVGGTVLVILADTDQYLGERSAAKVDKDQKSILDTDQDEAA